MGQSQTKSRLFKQYGISSYNLLSTFECAYLLSKDSWIWSWHSHRS